MVMEQVFPGFHTNRSGCDYNLLHNKQSNYKSRVVLRRRVGSHHTLYVLERLSIICSCSYLYNEKLYVS